MAMIRYEIRSKHTDKKTGEVQQGGLIIHTDIIEAESETNAIARLKERSKLLPYGFEIVSVTPKR